MGRNFESMRSQLDIKSDTLFNLFQTNSQHSFYSYSLSKYTHKKSFHHSQQTDKHIVYNFFRFPKTYLKNKKTESESLFRNESYYQKSYHRSLAQDIRGMAKGSSMSKM